jgi:integrase
LARPRKPVPSYRLHTPSGKAYSDFTDPVTGVRRSVCLGPWNSPESRAEHARLCLELSTGRGSPPPAGVTVAELLLAFLRHAEQHYRRADGTPTDEVANVKQMMRVVRESHGHVPAAEFGPTALRAVRQRMIDRGWSRRNVNLHVGRVRRVFKYGVEHELVPAAVWQALRAVGGLQVGRTAARETAPIRPVADELVDRTLPLLSRQVGGLVRFQRLTGCRPGEACALRRCDIDMSGDVWVYRPPQHKTQHRGRERVIHVGPHAQALLAEFPTDSPEEYVFSPQKELAERNARRAAERTTKYYASRQGWQQRKAAPRWRRRPRYTNKSYGHAIRKACKKNGLPAWAPNQLRHAFGTIVRREFGLEAAQAGLGHARADVTQVYAERDAARAAEVAAKIG